MYQNVNFSNFLDAFSDERKDTFSYEGKKALFEYLEEYEESTDEKIELDIIALCCEYTEYASAWDAMYEYQPEDMPVEGDEGDDLVEIQEKNEAEALRWLQDRTQVIEIEDINGNKNGAIIVEQF